MVQQTLVIIKADAVQRGITGDIITRFEKTGLKIIAMKMFVPTQELANQHYPISRKEFIQGMGQKTLDNYKELGMNALADFGTEDAVEIGKLIQKWLVDFITSAPVIALVLEGPHAIELVRKICGFTLPLKASPGTIRGDYSFDSSSYANFAKRPIKNLVHASGSEEEARFEVNLWFSPEELHQYDAVHHKHMTA